MLRSVLDPCPSVLLFAQKSHLESQILPITTKYLTIYALL